jgi:ADP-ribose pyrophosphatase YjhB (NUDIX family)
MKSRHYLQYSVPKKKFEEKMKRLYSSFFENGKKKALTENFWNKNYNNANPYNSVATYIFCYNKQGQKCVLAGKRRGYGSVGMYNVPTGLVGDENIGESVDDAAVREVYEEAGLRIDKTYLEDFGDTKYRNRWGEQLGKNFAVFLDGDTDDYKTSAGDGENDQFVWIPEEAIDAVPWAFEMDKMVKMKTLIVILVLLTIFIMQAIANGMNDKADNSPKALRIYASNR